MRLRLLALATAVATVFALPPVAGATGATADEPLLPFDPPLLGAEVPRGMGETVPAEPIDPATERVVDGEVDDWVGEPSGYAGTVVYSAGELISTDHLFDAFGPDDGRDAERMAVLDPLADTVPETYRLDPVFQADLPGQFGIPTPDAVRADTNYGDTGYRERQDLVELRVTADADDVWLLARTTQLHAADESALLVLADTGGRDDEPVEVPFNAGISSEQADVALLLAGDRGWAADLATGEIAELPAGSVATNPDGFTNAIEARVPRDLVTGGGGTSIAAATGAFDAGTGQLSGLGGTANLANVAFRLDEPVREWFDKRQALELHAGSIDAFLHPVDLGRIDAGATERYVPGPGYHERHFLSTTEGLAEERGREGVVQHYGVYLPSAYDGATPLPTTYWLHWRGGTAHVAGHVSPGIFRHQGEDRDGIVISPRGRGTSTWYVSRGHADLLEVWDDAMATFAIDEDRVYLSGHSMGGYGSYLMAILYPDRFAGAFPVAGPVTQGAWTGVDFDGCDEFSSGEFSPCYIETNDGRARDQHTRRMLDNLRHVPLAMFYASADELVPIAGAIRQHDRLVELGYTHRFYAFTAHEHFSHPVIDEWAEGVRYLDRFTRDEHPARITYIRDLAFEAAVNEVRAGGIDFDFRFDRAYWMSELGVADGAERARVDARSLARPGEPTVTAPEAGGPTAANQTGPFTMTGLREIADPLGSAPEAANAFEAALEGAAQVRFDLARMAISGREPITATVDTDLSLTLRLDGDFVGLPRVTVDGEPVQATRDGSVVTVILPAGSSELVIEPRGGPPGGGARDGGAPG